MNFKLKALVAATVLAATLPAHAALDIGQNATTGSSLVLTLLDTTHNISANFDLGFNYSDFNINAATGFAVSNKADAGQSINWNLATNADTSAAWSSFFATATAANTIWAIATVDTNGATNSNGGIGLIQTYAGVPAQLTSANLSTAINSFDPYLANMASDAAVTSQNHTAVANGADVAVNGTAAYTNANTAYGLNGAFFTVGPLASGAVGNALQVGQWVSVAGRNTQSQFSLFGNGAQFLLGADGSLTYSTNSVVAAVPEADTSAMMFAGLGLMGVIARRRTKQA